MTIFGNSDEYFINAMQNLGVSYNYLYSAYIWMSK